MKLFVMTVLNLKIDIMIKGHFYIIYQLIIIIFFPRQFLRNLLVYVLGTPAKIQYTSRGRGQRE